MSIMHIAKIAIAILVTPMLAVIALFAQGYGFVAQLFNPTISVPEFSKSFGDDVVTAKDVAVYMQDEIASFKEFERSLTLFETLSLVSCTATAFLLILSPAVILRRLTLPPTSAVIVSEALYSNVPESLPATPPATAVAVSPSLIEPGLLTLITTFLTAAP